MEQIATFAASLPLQSDRNAVETNMIKTEIGYTTPEVITVRGMDLASDLLGKHDFLDGLVLCALDRLPSPQEKNVLNAILVLGLDHGLSPSALAARLTHLGAPEALQGAVAAGLLGAGSRFLGTTERATVQFLEFSDAIETDGGERQHAQVAAELIRVRGARNDVLYGYGHPIHKKVDPRVAVLRGIARDNGFFGRNWLLADAVAEHLLRREKPLSMNASAAIGATIGDMGVNPTFGAALMLVARCGGLLAHLIEEKAHPIASATWDLVLSQDSRNVLPSKAGTGAGHPKSSTAE